MLTTDATALDAEFTLAELKDLKFTLPVATLNGPDRLALAAVLLQAECPPKMNAQYFVEHRNHLKTTARQMDWAAMAKASNRSVGGKPKRVKAYSTALFRVMEQIEAALWRCFASDLKKMDWPDNFVLGDEEGTPQEHTAQRVDHGEAWYDAETWRVAHAAAADSKTDESKEWKRALESMQASGQDRRFAKLPDLTDLESLKKSHPNFTEVIDFVSAQIALHKRKNTKGFTLRPLLLEGPPGVGKSHFARSLAAVMGTEVCSLNMASQSAGFVLSGLHRTWNGSCTGEVAACLKRSKTLSPIFFLDELDKSNKEAKSDPLGPLYVLLEATSAARFTDEYLGVAINASQMIWLAAANDADSIPLPLLSRFTRFSIASPTPQEMRDVAGTYFQKMRESWAELPDQMPEAWLSKLESLSLRTMGQAFEKALGRAAIRAEMKGSSPIELMPEDMQTEATKRFGMGFIGC